MRGGRRERHWRQRNNKSLVRADETMEVDSVIFFLEGPSFIPSPAMNLLAACQPTAPAYPPSTDTVRKKSLGLAANETHVSRGNGGFREGICFQNPCHWQVLILWTGSRNELMNPRIQNESEHRFRERLLYSAKCWETLLNKRGLEKVTKSLLIFPSSLHTPPKKKEKLKKYI